MNKIIIANPAGDHEESSSRNVLDSMDEMLDPGVELLDWVLMEEVRETRGRLGSVTVSCISAK